MRLVRYQNGSSVYGSVTEPVCMALLQREPLYVFCGLEARSSASGKNVDKTGIMAKTVNALIPSKGQ